MLFSQLNDHISLTILSTKQVFITRNILIQFSNFLNQLTPVLKTAIKNYPDANFKNLAQEINLAHALTTECAKKSKIYLLVHCRRVVNSLQIITRDIGHALTLLPADIDRVEELAEEMAMVEYKLDPAEEEILQLIESGIQERISDRSFANNLLALIVNAVGIPKDRPAIGREVEEFMEEVSEAKNRKDLADAIRMEQVAAILEKADAALSFKEKEVKYHSKRDSLGVRLLEPLHSFYCPITGEVMEDPVETSSGQTFERSAIDRWIADGNTTCPLTMTPLVGAILRPNRTLRKSIEEWKERNTIITIASIKSKLESSGEEEAVKCLKQLQQLCEERELNREYLVLENYLEVFLGFLSRSNLLIRNCTLSILMILAKGSDDIKELIGNVDDAIGSIVRSLARRSEERKLAVALLLELSKNKEVLEKIGKVQGCIFLLVTISNSDNNQAVCDARELLESLSFLDGNVVQMSLANCFKPLLHRLHSGSDDTKKLMVTTLAEMELTDHNKANLFSDGALEPLLDLLSHSDADMQKVAIKALQSLSSLRQNGLQMIRQKAIRPLLDCLRFQVVSSSILYEQVADTIMNIAISAEEIEPDESLVLLESDDDISWLFSLIILKGPTIQRSILRTFYAMCKSTSAKDMRTKLKQFSAVRVLIPHCEHTDLVVRANAVKLLACLLKDGDDSLLSEHAGQSFLEALLSIIQTSTDDEEIADAMGIISNLPTGYNQFTQWLLNAEALPNIVKYLVDARINGSSKNEVVENAARALCLFTVSTDQESQKRAAEAGAIPLLVHLLGSGTALTKRYAAISLAQFSESSFSLSNPVKKQGFFCCYSAPPVVGCLIHSGVCSVETSFCLLEADAVNPLVGILKEQDSELCEAALRALSTLIDEKMLQSGCKVISEAKGIGAIVRLLNSQDTNLLERALHVLEKIFRLEEYKKMYGSSAQMPLVDIAQRTSGKIRALAARILAHLGVLHDQSSYF